MKKLFISQPMRGRTNKEILEERKKAIEHAKQVLGEDVEELKTFFSDFGEDKKPLHYIAKSIEYLAEADVAYFVKGWEKARGCRIEKMCADEYGVPQIIDNN